MADNITLILCLPIGKWRRKLRVRRERIRWERSRNDAMFRATNGERIPRLEREMYDLPDWTG